MANETDLITLQETANAVFRRYVRTRTRLESAKRELADATEGMLMAKGDFEAAQKSLDEFVSKTVKAGGLGGDEG